MSSQKQLTLCSKARRFTSAWFLRALVPAKALLEGIMDGKVKSLLLINSSTADTSGHSF